MIADESSFSRVIFAVGRLMWMYIMWGNVWIVDVVSISLNEVVAWCAKVLQHVRLPLMSPKFLVGTVGSDLLVKSDDVCRDLVDEAKNYLLLPQERPQMQGPRTRPRKPIRCGEVLFAGQLTNICLIILTEIAIFLLCNYRKWYIWLLWVTWMWILAVCLYPGPDIIHLTHGCSIYCTGRWQ